LENTFQHFDLLHNKLRKETKSKAPTNEPSLLTAHSLKL